MADRETLKGLGLGVAMLAAGGVGLWLGELTARAVFYLTGGLIVIVGSVSGARQLRRSRKRQRERDLDRLLADTGRRLGLSLGRAARPESRSLEGTIDGVRVAVTSQPSRADPTSQVTGVTVTAHHPLLAEVQIRSRWKAPETVEADATPRGAVETGDVLLDGLVEVRGAASLCLALLAHDA